MLFCCFAFIHLQNAFLHCASLSLYSLFPVSVYFESLFPVDPHMCKLQMTELWRPSVTTPCNCMHPHIHGQPASSAPFQHTAYLSSSWMLLVASMPIKWISGKNALRMFSILLTYALWKKHRLDAPGLLTHTIPKLKPLTKFFCRVYGRLLNKATFVVFYLMMTSTSKWETNLSWPDYCCVGPFRLAWRTYLKL